MLGMHSRGGLTLADLGVCLAAPTQQVNASIDEIEPGLPHYVAEEYDGVMVQTMTDGTVVPVATKETVSSDIDNAIARTAMKKETLEFEAKEGKMTKAFNASTRKVANAVTADPEVQTEIQRRLDMLTAEGYTLEQAMQELGVKINKGTGLYVPRGLGQFRWGNLSKGQKLAAGAAGGAGALWLVFSVL